MTRILVLSDTHIPTAADNLSAVIAKEAKKSDCCLHAGDFVSYSVFEALSSFKKTYGVYGNMDQERIKIELPEQQILKFEDVTLSLTHGAGHPANLIGYLQNKFSEKIDEIDIFVFGHSHCATDEEIDKKIYFNPGSPTDKVFACYRSYGILEINGSEIKRRIIKIE
ncbi:MAG: metallophosphoesterase [Candidatus Omnitrophica bacterium]|nr:metallophosphoesterase [Candidatus Omnitrophota bacterium]